MQHLQKVTNWPLDESGVYARLEWLATRPALHDSDDAARFQWLIEKLGDIYASIHSTFDEFRPHFDPMEWHRPRHDEEALQSAKLLFYELMSTTRFDVVDLTQAGKIIATKFQPFRPLRRRHAIALAALVCLINALESLEELTDTQAAGKARLLVDAAESSDQAASWLDHLTVEDLAGDQLRREVEKTQAETVQKIKSERSKQATQAAKKLRTALTPELAASHLKANPGKPQKALVIELAENYNVSERTVRTRMKEAKNLNPMQ